MYALIASGTLTHSLALGARIRSTHGGAEPRHATDPRKNKVNDRPAKRQSRGASQAAQSIVSFLRDA